MTTPETADFRAMTADSIGKDILAALVAEIKLLPDVWVKIPQMKQDDVIDRLRARVETNIKMAVHLIAAEGRTAVPGGLEQITIKDGVKAVVKFSGDADNLHELYEATGESVLVVVANPAESLSGINKIRGEADQRAMDLGHEYHANDGGGMEDAVIIEGETLALAAPKDEYELEDPEDEAEETNSPYYSERDADYWNGYEAGKVAESGEAPEAPKDTKFPEVWIEGWHEGYRDYGQNQNRAEEAA
ncbi:MAG: cell division protein FtsK [Zoogloeaceae bacterium]|jgi:hypothetical protein|nr:cell division protein FtsK [Zoogloeaceae bacterium]